MFRNLYHQHSFKSVHHSKFDNSHLEEELVNQNQILSMHEIMEKNFKVEIRYEGEHERSRQKQ